MLDILLKQMELQDIEQHMGIHTSVCENVSRLMKCMVTAARVGLSSHVCSLKVRIMIISNQLVAEIQLDETFAFFPGPFQKRYFSM